MLSRKEVGCAGEKIAVEYLKNKGLKIVCTNYKRLGGEIDIIARNSESLILVEVKSKSENAAFWPEENINSKKIEKILNTFYCFLNDNPEYESLDPQIDIIIVEISNNPKIKHFENILID